MPTTLTDADKVLRNDVGKRMADALEAIAEGSGGSAKIEEMTQAEYDQLTPAQKADGTLRAISDGQTKIQDIDNVNITTSDNGKLLGVSVSDSNISVSAVETTAADIPYAAGVSVADKLATIDSKLHIEAGKKQASSTQAVRVTFAQAYTTIPHVVIVPNNSTSSREYIRSCTITAITTTYFEFVEQAISKQLNSFLNGTDDCEWIAYGV